MILDATTKTIELILGAAATTNAMPVTVDYVDLTTTTTLAGSSDTQSNGTTAVTIVAAPAASTQRKVNALTVFNADTASKVVTIRLNNNATLRNIISVTLQVGDTIGYSDTGGWYLLDSDGNLKSVQAASATSIAAAIDGATAKTSPIEADEIGIWDSVSGLLNKVTFTNIFKNFSLMPSVASSATTDIFGAVGATIDLTGTTTITGLTACISAQVGSVKRVIPSNAAGVSFTASANMKVDGATSGTVLMPQNAIIEVLATSTTTFNVRTVFASGTWTPAFALATPGTSSFGTYSAQLGHYIKIGNKVTAWAVTVSGTFSVGTGSGNFLVTGLPYTSNAATAYSGCVGLHSGGWTTLAPTHMRIGGSVTDINFYNASGATYTAITASHCGNAMRSEFVAEYFV